MKRSGSIGILVLLFVILVSLPGCRREITPEKFAASLRLEYTLKGHAAAVNAVAFSPDGKILASADNDGDISFWDPGSGERKHTHNFAHTPVYAMAYSPDGKFLALSGKGQAAILFDGTNIQSLPTSFIAHQDQILALAWGPNHILATSSCAEHAPTFGCSQGEAAIWKVEQFGKPPVELKRFNDHADWINAMACSPNGKWLLTGGADNMINIFQAPEWELVKIMPGHTNRINALAFPKKNSGLAVSAGLDGAAILWEIPQGREKQFMKSEGLRFRGMAISPDGKMIVAGGGGGKIVIWLASTGAVLKEIPGLEAEVAALSFSPDGNSFAAAMSDNNVLVWTAK